MTPDSLLPPRLEGRLFPRFFLDRGLAETEAWAALPPQAVAAFRDAVVRCMGKMRAQADPNEAETRDRLIHPVLEALGWSWLPEQQGARAGDVADALLYPDPAALTAAAAHPHGSTGRYRPARVVSEHKGWRVPLDRATAGGSPVK